MHQIMTTEPEKESITTYYDQQLKVWQEVQENCNTKNISFN